MIIVVYRERLSPGGFKRGRKVCSPSDRPGAAGVEDLTRTFLHPQHRQTAVINSRSPDPARTTAPNTHREANSICVHVRPLGPGEGSNAGGRRCASLSGQQRIPNTNSRWTWPKAKPWGLPGMRGDFCSKMYPGAVSKWGSRPPLRLSHAMVSLHRVIDPSHEHSAAIDWSNLPRDSDLLWRS